MLFHLLRVKIKQLIVSESSTAYPGSIGLPEELIESAGLKVFEQVHVNNLTNGNRILTYVVPTKKPGYVSVNGAASILFKKNDKIHVIAFAEYTEEEASQHEPIIVYTDESNMLVRIDGYSYTPVG